MPKLRLHADALRTAARKVGDQTDYRIAQRLGLEQSTVSRLLTGRTAPSVSTLVAMRSAYGISLDVLVPGDREPAKAGASS